MNEANPRKQGSKAPATKEDTLGKIRDTITQITLAVISVTLGIYKLIGVGEEVTIGVGAAKKIYYTAGYDANMWLLASFICIFITFLFIGMSGKK